MKKNQWKFVSETDYLNNNIRGIEYPQVIAGDCGVQLNQLLWDLNNVQYAVHHFSQPAFHNWEQDKPIAIITDPKVEKLLYQLHKAVFEAAQKYDTYYRED